MNTDVLIAGAGPTGMMAAAALLEFGVSCRIIDKAPIRSERSRALVVQAKTLELFDRFGMAGSLVAKGRRSANVEWFIGDHPPIDIDLTSLGPVETPFPFLLFVSQVETERELENHLSSRGLQVERPLELVSFSQDAQHIPPGPRIRRR